MFPIWSQIILGIIVFSILGYLFTQGGDQQPQFREG